MKLNVPVLSRLGICCFAWMQAGGLLWADEPPTVKAAWFARDISCKVGTPLAGYGENDISVAKIDDLQLHGLALDDGRTKILLMSFDLLGMDVDIIRRMRHACAEVLGVDDANVLLTCTHTHGGPHTRRYSRQKNDGMKPDPFAKAEDIDVEYVAFLESATVDAVKNLVATGKWRECRVGFFSSQCDENRNRRYTTVENCASFNAHRRALYQLTTGIADKELGTVAFFDPVSMMPLYVVGNYAAHPLASHAPGRGGLRITSDFPGFYRRYIESETGAAAMFVQGAAGDLVPKDDELGVDASRKVGESLAKASVAALMDIERNSARFVMEKPRLCANLVTMNSRLRAPYRKMFGQDTKELELQVLSIGDVAFVGVPGELVNELGLEIKWHSPFKRTFIAYCATGYFGYISTLNQIAAGGYEPQSQHFASRDTLRLVSTVQNALLDLRAKLFPEDSAGDDPYPDNLVLPLVNLPGGFKASKWQKNEK